MIRLLVNGARAATWLVALLILAGPAGAVEVRDLYTAEVPVEGQGSAERNSAVAAAFRRVLVKVTGRRQPLAGQGLGSDIAGFVQQYRYLVEEDDEGAPRRRLRVQFDKNAVDAWVRDQGLSVWGSNRPGVLLWMGLEQDGRRRLFVPEIDPATSALLRRAAASRGLALTLPLMDLEDRRRLQVSDLWGDFTDPVREAARRYESDAVLTGRISEAGPRLWRGRWTLIQGGQVERWSAESGDLGAVLSDGLDRAADMLAARFAPRGASPGTEQVELRVRGVSSFADYGRLRRHLESLELVTALELQAAGPRTLTFLLGVRGADATVAQSLGLGGVLVPVGTAAPPGAGPPPGPAAGPTVLEYRLSP